MPVVCILVVGIRFFIRRHQKGGLGMDDWLAFLSLVSSILRGTAYQIDSNP